MNLNGLELVLTPRRALLLSAALPSSSPAWWLAAIFLNDTLMGETDLLGDELIDLDRVETIDRFPDDSSSLVWSVVGSNSGVLGSFGYPCELLWLFWLRLLACDSCDSCDENEIGSVASLRVLAPRILLRCLDLRSILAVYTLFTLCLHFVYFIFFIYFWFVFNAIS